MAREAMCNREKYRVQKFICVVLLAIEANRLVQLEAFSVQGKISSFLFAYSSLFEPRYPHRRSAKFTSDICRLNCLEAKISFPCQSNLIKHH